MSQLSKSQQKQIVDQWKRAGPRLERMRDEELRNWKYDWRIVDALLDIGTHSYRPPERMEENGLVIMQRGFMELAEKKGLLPRNGVVS